MKLSRGERISLTYEQWYPPGFRGHTLRKAKNKRNREGRLLPGSTDCRYLGTLVHMTKTNATAYPEVERVQTGVRLEKQLLKVLKAVAELKDMTLGDLLEGVILHAFEGKTPFSTETLKEIEQFEKIYGMTLRATDSHHMKERRK
jgi:hypothetical protein